MVSANEIADLATGQVKAHRVAERASTMVWILALNPPRECPIAWLSPDFFGTGAVLVSAHDGAVDHRAFVVSVGREMLQDPLPEQI
jgi:hypothetical protein